MYSGNKLYIHLCCFTLCRLFFFFFFFFAAFRVVSGEGSGIQLYRFLIVAFSSTLPSRIVIFFEVEVVDSKMMGYSPI